MADVTEIERLLVRLVGDNKLYVETLKEAERRTEQFSEDAQGRFRDAQGKYVKMSQVMEAQGLKSLASLMRVGEGMQTVGKAAQKAGMQVRQLGSYLSLRLTAPLVGSGIAAAKTFGDFEQVLGQMQGLAGVAANEIGGITTEVKALAIATGKGPTELAEAIYNIRSSGVVGKTALDTLTVSAKAAAAGLGETRVVSDAVTSVLNAYGTEVMQASQVTDILVAAVREGKAEADALAPVMGRLVPVAAAMGIQFDEVAGMMAVMSRTGLDAAEASVSIGAILNTLLKPSDEAATVLRSAGLSMAQLRDIAKKPGGLIEVMRILDRTFGDNEEALSQIIPETRAFRGVMNVLSQDAGIVDTIMGNVRNSVGATEAAFKAGADTLNRQWGQAMSEIKTVLIDLGNTMKPALIAIIDQVKSLAEWFKSLSDSTKKYVVIVGALAAALGPVLVAMGALISVAGSLSTVIGMLLTSPKALLVTLNLLKVGVAGLAVGIAVGLVAAAHKASRAFFQLDASLAKLKSTANGFQAMQDDRFKRQMEGLAELPVDKQREELLVMKRNLEGNLASTKQIIGDTKNEIAGLQGGKGADPIYDAHGIELAQGHLADSEQRAAQFKSQLDQVNESLKQTAVVAKEAGDGLMGTIRPEAIEAFGKQMEDQLRNLEIENAGKSMGMTSDQIQRQQAFAALEAELKATGAVINDQEFQKLNIMAQQMSMAEKQLKLREDEAKEQQELQKALDREQESMASRAEAIIKSSQTPIQELKAQLMEVAELHKKGALTRAEADIAANKMVRDFASADSMTKASAGAAIEFGSAESQANRLQQSDKSTEKGVWKMVALADINRRTQEDILAELRKDDPVLTIPGG